MNELATQPAGEMVIDHETSQIEHPRNPRAIEHLSMRPISTMAVPEMQAFLQTYHERRAAFRRDLFNHMVEGLHYGVPPGCEPKKKPNGEPMTNPKQWMAKPSLYKAGADMICDLLTVEPRFHLLTPPAGNPIIMSCDLICRGVAWFPGWEAGQVVANGHGAASGNAGDRDINKTIKMAEKRAKVGAVIHMLGASDLFTQDIEDTPPRERPQADPNAPRVPTREERRAAAEGPAAAPVVDPSSDEPPRVTASMLNDLFNGWRAKNPKADPNEFFNFARKLLRTESHLKRPADWSIDSFHAIKEAIGA